MKNVEENALDVDLKITKDLSIPSKNESGSINIVDKSLISIPLELITTGIKDVELLLDKKLLIVTTYLVKRLIQIQDRNLAKDKLQRALKRLYDIKNELSNIEEELDLQMNNLIARLTELRNEPDLYTGQKNQKFCFDTYRKRVSWILGEYLSKKSFSDTVSLLVKAEGIEKLVDLQLFETFNRIKSDLEQHVISSALLWAEENEQKLAKVGSVLLHELRLQKIVMAFDSSNMNEMLELIGKYVTNDVLNRCPDAKKIITAAIFYAGNPMVEIQKEPISKKMSTLTNFTTVDTLLDDEIVESTRDEAYGAGSAVHARYIPLVGDNRWSMLIREFERDMTALYGFREKSVLEDLIQAGFSAIKSKGCRDGKSKTCPSCLPEWSSYVEQIPTLHKLQSILICPITGAIMDYSNPPFASPDGYVISKAALDILNRNNGGNDYVICPNTNKKVHISEFKRIFIT
ncbi:conserved hypothetical protein [Theileria equi strain WA]|uniref:RING-Gid-type domain-containing protein n=1 Tax=Theileria equi strain WA TaxID=1537102 RepID=L1LCD2_THEEQ|nr:conserved hypothetical protein [Theileria equi strain WA]EKX72910.1 conserved hypothetical protein [Theileria equi strain WA]|eukprot:XP_004832362.1 conserved hypothetical protein [Theileria equi strain WA]